MLSAPCFLTSTFSSSFSLSLTSFVLAFCPLIPIFFPSLCHVCHCLFQQPPWQNLHFLSLSSMLWRIKKKNREQNWFSYAYLDCFSLQFETIECVNSLVCIIWVDIVYKAISQTLSWRQRERYRWRLGFSKTTNKNHIFWHVQCVAPVILSLTSLQDSISPMLPNKLLNSSWVMFWGR